MSAISEGSVFRLFSAIYKAGKGFSGWQSDTIQKPCPPHMKVSFALFSLLILGVGCGGNTPVASPSPTPAPTPASTPGPFVETFVSPFGLHEGYATDGTFHYLDDASKITK